MTLRNLPLDPLPNYWSILDEYDQQEYLRLRSEFHCSIEKSQRKDRIDVFVQRLKCIRDFIEKRDPSTMWKRVMVSGVMFLSSSLAINIQQLRVLMGRCKSSINGSLQQLGYVSKPSTQEIDQEMIQMVSLLKDDHAQMRKWTIRIGTFPDEYKSQSKCEEEVSDPDPVVPPSPPVSAENAQRSVQLTFPCPAKCRHKFYEMFYPSFSLQTVI